jgi:hypothetical protein
MKRKSMTRFLLGATVWHLLAWLGVATIAGVLAVVWTAQQTKMTWALGIFLVSSLGIQSLKGRLPSLFIFMLVSVALLNGSGGAFEWFDGYVWFDEFVHTYTGFAGLAAIGFLYARDSEARRVKLVAWCAGMGLALGIGWEIVEALGGELGLVDTLSDIALDTLGAALGGLFARHALSAVRT